MSQPVIEVENLSKRYFLGEMRAQSIRETLELWWGRGGKGREAREKRELWALRDVSFQVKQGEILGVIGANGAGKSTLLKILSRITEPESGVAVMRGRVASLLEVGTGFHPDLTGRENIFLNGAILGLKRSEIVARFDEIVAFSSIEKFVDTPVKRYSSGMYVRLAFAVAAHLEPDILIIDEVLAVGDSSFQKKCLGKLEEASRSGRTILFVSHNMVAVRSFCSRALWMEQGRVAGDGAPGEVINRYLVRPDARAVSRRWTAAEAPGAGGAKIRSIRVENSDPAEGFDGIAVERPVRVTIEVETSRSFERLDTTLHFFNEEGILAFGTGTADDHVAGFDRIEAGLYRSTLVIPARFLNIDLYAANLLIVENSTEIIHLQEGIFSFRVEETEPRAGGWHGPRVGVVRPQMPWRVERLERPEPSTDLEIRLS
ncbi:lipopolysaccharide transport system ATP-binding protein [Verrucomicrobium sp. GAS474]|uniref:ABC transporter ATP-binding protein n=1 Tax=Verrucomicrobium sp. GAS474 TaxID=1882831 RepID=UPI000879C4B3|nr:ABC transporter ATP-binding protein [Verrucomicrobium sp. GAS474]SDT86177.1 lipopolysaccharide transport system ATP-binding protein [Verrucomicrobium sp. GAS474]